MRILSVSPRVTSRPVGGSQRRVGGILDRLSAHHEVVQFCQPRLHERRVAGASRERVNRSLASAAVSEIGDRMWTSAPLLSGVGLRLTGPEPLRSLLGWADVTMVEFPWQFARCARLAPDARLVLSAHNVEVEKFESFAEAAEARLTRNPCLRYIERVERAALERADAVIAVSERDRRRLAERYDVDPRRVVVARNGVDLEAIAPAGLERRAAARRTLGLGDAPVVLFAGADVTPNRRGLEWVLRLARRADRFTFLVVGTIGGRPRREGNLVVTGHVEEFEPCLAAADLSVCPIEYGGGTKVKLIESLGAGLPTVAFEHSVDGLDVRDGEHLLVADRSTDSLLAALERLASDRALAERLGDAARRHAVEHHDWDRIAECVERALAAAVAGTAPQAASVPGSATAT
jgi:glycosyltransferase involved in cell wall biosynthesis